MTLHHSNNEHAENRRSFLKKLTLAATAIGTTELWAQNARNPGPQPDLNAKAPWYRRVTRWGQTNITEIDPLRYDIGWWRRYWRQTQTQGVVINAGGIFAYYPSAVPFHHRAEYLGTRDLFGELCEAAHQEGLAVFARMDSNRAHPDCYDAHPDWFAVDASGKPYKAGDLLVACVNSPYYSDHIPAILREICQRYRPEGFTDNSWSGLGRASPCFCVHCEQKFRERTGRPLPRSAHWDDPVYRQWIEWNYARRLEIWDLNNSITRSAGGADCIWVGMNSGSIAGQCSSFRDYRRICQRAKMIMLDHQSRSDAAGFQQNGETGKLIHELLGWDKLVPESMAMYQAGRPTFRLASKPEPEARLWMLDGIAGGLQPWWHYVGAYQEDRRMYRTAAPIYRWHEANEVFLVHRQPVAGVGVVWSQQNTDFFGREDPEILVEQPWRGMTQALVRARIPYLPVHADDLDRAISRFSLLLLPNLGAMSNSQLQAVRHFVQAGGGLLATGETSLYDEWGESRSDFGLADLFRAHRTLAATDLQSRRRRASETEHTYLRLTPELRALTDGPHIPSEPSVSERRHPVLAGFEQTDLLAFGGELEPLKLEQGAEVPMMFVPQSPVYPPETAWMRTPKTDIPGLVLSTHNSGARVVFLPADLDRRFGREHLPDHGNLLANLVRWAAKDQLPLQVHGPGLIDCHLYRQESRLLLHLVNLTNAGTWRQPVEELLPVGPLDIKVHVPADMHLHHVRSLVSGGKVRAKISRDWMSFRLTSVLDHEVVLLS